MINAKDSLDYLYRGLRSYISFRLSSAVAWLKYGHFVRQREIEHYFRTHAIRKVHIGATYEAEGFLNSQVCGRVPIDITSRLPFPDASIDMLYSSHVVEHIHKSQFISFLRDSRRVLRRNGVNIIATPSISKLVRTLYGPDDEAREILLARGRRFSWESFHTPGQQLNITMRAFGHQWLYDMDFIERAAHEAGYTSVRSVDNVDLPDPALSEYIRNRKPPGWFLETETFILTA